MNKLVPAILGLAFVPCSTRADWNPGELPLDPVMHAWFNSLSSKLALVCCSEADGRPAETWDYDGDHYVVTVFGKTMAVPNDAVVQVPNRMGEAMVWTVPWGSHEPDSVVCFLPGPSG